MKFWTKSLLLACIASLGCEEEYSRADILIENCLDAGHYGCERCISPDLIWEDCSVDGDYLSEYGPEAQHSGGGYCGVDEWGDDLLIAYYSGYESAGCVL